MTTLVITVIAILLFGIVITAAVMYVDTDEISAVGMAPAAASSLVNVVEASSSFKNERGYYPVSITDLKSEFEIQPRGFRTSDFVISDGVACLSMPYETESDKLLKLASAKIKGSVVTDTCGSSGITGRRFLALSMDGVNLPMASNMITGPSPTPTPTPAPAFSQPNTCASAPDNTASSSARAAWLACYAVEVKKAAVYWIYAGKGLTPSVNQLYNAGYLHNLPPSYPEMTTVSIEYVTVSGVKVSRVRMNMNGSSGMTASSAFATLVANASSGFLTKYGASYWMVYSQPIYSATDYASVLKNPTWDGPIPTDTSALEDKAAYIAYRLLKIDSFARDALSKGQPYGANTFALDKLEALGYPVPPLGSFTDNSYVNYNNGTGIYGRGTPPLSPRTGGPNYWVSLNQPFATGQAMCNMIELYTYTRAVCDSYGGYYNALPKLAAP